MLKELPGVVHLQVLTIGPGSENEESITSIGQAAHIYAASERGPRARPDLSFEYRSSIKNGIWMCESHAKLIDSDMFLYSAETLIQWKEIAEKETYRLLKELERDNINSPQTLISINNIIFSGTWISANKDIWDFEIDHFIEHDINLLRAFALEVGNLPSYEKFVIVESQGDGRELNNISWKLNGAKYQITCNIISKAPRTNPNDLGGDFALGEGFGMEIENGDWKITEGIDTAIADIRVLLSSQLGDWKSNYLIGSSFIKHFWKYQNDTMLLNRLIKIEVIRLFTVRIPDSLSDSDKPMLDFVNRVIGVEILNITPKNRQIPVKLKLEWGNGEYWEGVISIFVGTNPTTINS